MAAVPSIGRASRVDGAHAPEADLTRDLYERYANQIFRYCLHQLGSREEAEDAVQSTFLNAFRGIRRGVVPEMESAWLFKIAHNVCLSRRRSSWRRGKIESAADFELVEELTPAPARRADELIGLQDVLETMPESQRRAILLREWQGLSYREIAEELELSQAAVETLIFRARRTLAQGLERPPAQARKRLARAADLGNLVTAIKSLLVGGSAAAKVAATVAVVSGTTVVAAAPVQPHRSHQPKAPATSTPAPAPTQPSSGTTPGAADAAAASPAGGLRPPAVRRGTQGLPVATPAGTALRGNAATPDVGAPATAAEHAPAPAPVEQPPPAVEQQPAPAQPPVQQASPPVAPAPPAKDDTSGKGRQGETAQTPTQTTPAAKKDEGSKSSGKDGAPGQAQKDDGSKSAKDRRSRSVQVTTDPSTSTETTQTADSSTTSTPTSTTPTGTTTTGPASTATAPTAPTVPEPGDRTATTLPAVSAALQQIAQTLGGRWDWKSGRDGQSGTEKGTGR